MANGYSTKEPDWATQQGYPTSISGSLQDNLSGRVQNLGNQRVVGDVLAGKKPTASPQEILQNKQSGKSGNTTGTDNASANYLAALYAQYGANRGSYYDNALARINAAYDSASQSYGDIYNRGMGALNDSYKAQQDKLGKQANDSLRDAYVNRMMAEKALPQKLAALGISGGASETSLSDIVNRENTARANINRGWNDNLADLAANYSTNANNLFNAYQQQMANLANNRASALNQLEMQMVNDQNDYDMNYLKLLASNPKLLTAVMNQSVAGQEAVVPQADMNATNGNVAIETKTANPTTDLSRYAQLLAAANLTDTKNVNPTSLALQLRNQGWKNADILELLNGLA